MIPEHTYTSRCTRYYYSCTRYVVLRIIRLKNMKKKNPENGELQRRTAYRDGCSQVSMYCVCVWFVRSVYFFDIYIVGDSSREAVAEKLYFEVYAFGWEIVGIKLTNASK